MKNLAFLLIGLALSASAAATDAPRLMLWVTDSIGTGNADQCKLAKLPAATLPTRAPTLTEQDVTAWDAHSARWRLNPTRFTAANAAHTLQDHCFVLAIDGKLVSSGVVLSSYSARLITFPTLSVSSQNNVLSLQLNSGHQGDRSQPNNVEALDAVLAQRPRPVNPPTGGCCAGLARYDISQEEEYNMNPTLRPPVPSWKW